MKTGIKLLLAGGAVAGLYFLPRLLRAEEEEGISLRRPSLVASPVAPGGRAQLTLTAEYINPFDQRVTVRMWAGGGFGTPDELAVAAASPYSVLVPASPTRWDTWTTTIGMDIPSGVLPAVYDVLVTVTTEPGGSPPNAVVMEEVFTSVLPVEAAVLQFRNPRLSVS
jgi:hypothetical protein